jgi:nucleoside-diphosphate-sugar epimerase
VDWCEDHRQETIRSNVLGAVTLADVASQQGGIPLLYFGTGCLYQYDPLHPMGSGKGFREIDPPNYDGSFYSRSKVMTECMLMEYPDVLILRLRMPISDDLHPRSLITKLISYPKLVNIPNSITILHDLLPLSVEMLEEGHRGVFNFTNPGTVSHNQIMELYKQYIDPNKTWENFTEEDQAKILRAGRSNNELDVTKLMALYPNLPLAYPSLVMVFKRMKENIQHIQQ